MEIKAHYNFEKADHNSFPANSSNTILKSQQRPDPRKTQTLLQPPLTPSPRAPKSQILSDFKTA